MEEEEEEEEEEKEGNREFDGLTEVTGEFGRFHFVAYFLLYFSTTTHCFQSLANKWLTRPTDYWCARWEAPYCCSCSCQPCNCSRTWLIG